jgi:hypothetical protein
LALQPICLRLAFLRTQDEECLTGRSGPRALMSL